MGVYSNIGKLTALTVFGNPDSFQSLIRNHGLLVKIKQALACTCNATNSGSPDMECEICNGDGYVYTYQRRFFVIDEDSKAVGKKFYPYWTPIMSVVKAQNVTSQIQGGITDFSVVGFNDTEIEVTETIDITQKKRVTYSFDGWTHVASEQLEVDAANGLMYANGTVFNAEYQSSNPLNAYADIAQIIRIWNIDTGVTIDNYTFEGRTIKTSEPIVADKMYAEYYYSDLTQAIATDIATRDNNEQWTHMLASGETKMAFYAFWDLAKGDLITVAAVVLWKNEVLNHTKDLDRLHEIEVYQLNNVIIDEDNKRYYIDEDYILQGRNIRWLTANKPKVGKVISVRYAFKPSFIIFDDNVLPNNLENKIYPKLCMVKNWSQISKDDIKRLIGN